MLKSDNRVSHQVSHIDGLALRKYFGVLANEKPAHVRKEDAPLGVVRICVAVAEFVMHPVIARPLID